MHVILFLLTRNYCDVAVQLCDEPVCLDLPADEEEVWLSGDESPLPLADISSLGETAPQPCSSTHEEPVLPFGGEPAADQTSCGGFLIRLRPTSQESALPITATPATYDTIGTVLPMSSFSSHDVLLFYTGLCTDTFDKLCLFCCGCVEADMTKLSLRDELILTLMKLRLNLFNEDIAYRFGIHKTSVSKIFHKWLDILYIKLKDFIVWPDRSIVRKTLPCIFKPKFSKVVSIIDCTEIFIERPVNLLARAQTFSNYKKHNTVKFLIGITPTGCISFVSKAWGGRVSDDELTRSSGIFGKLYPGDVIMADRGFRLHEDLGLLQCELIVPASTKGKKQLSPKDVEKSRALSHVRIHVERVIGMLKNRYTILQGTLPISLVKRPSDRDVTTIDKVMTVCAALCNLGDLVVPK